MSHLDLIDWRLLAFSSLWVLGLALLLAAVSAADYAAVQRQARLRAVLGQPGYQLAVNGGLVLFCVGVLGSAAAWWERILWALLAAAFAYQVWGALRASASAAGTAAAAAAAPAPRVRRVSARQRRWVIAGVAAVIVLVPLLLAAGPLGLFGPRTYLIVAQNSDELRPTGGFITGVAAVTLRGVRAPAFSLADANQVDDFTAGPYPAPPEPLRAYMLSELWVFRDANWSPDFPASARQMGALYTLGQGRPVHGVIAFDQTALQAALGVLGPVTVEGLPQPVSTGNFLAVMREAWSETPVETWRTQRKDFMAPLAQALLARLKSERDPRTFLALARAGLDLLAERHVLVHFDSALLAALPAARGWDGAVRPGDGDYLRVVDANVGFNKANAVVEPALAYSVDLTDPAAPLGTLTVSYTHTLTAPKACEHFGVANTSTQYGDYVNDCYWNYWRVLLPAGAQVLGATPNAVPGAWLLSGQADFAPAQVGVGPAGTAQVAGLFVLPPAAAHQTAITYLLPEYVLDGASRSQRTYRLRVQKQPGTAAVPLSLSLAYPADWRVVSSSAPMAVGAPGLAQFALDLRLDFDFELVFAQN